MKGKWCHDLKDNKRPAFCLFISCLLLVEFWKKKILTWYRSKFSFNTILEFGFFPNHKKDIIFTVFIVHTSTKWFHIANFKVHHNMKVFKNGLSSRRFCKYFFLIRSLLDYHYQ